MNEHQLLCFLTVSRTLNFSAAARELYCTQPALSYQIRSLEKELDAALFRRTTTRPLTVTVPAAHAQALQSDNRIANNVRFIFSVGFICIVRGSSISGTDLSVRGSTPSISLPSEAGGLRLAGSGIRTTRGTRGP